MKRLSLIFVLIFIFSLSVILVILSAKGFETNKLNSLITKKIEENNEHINLSLNKIKFKFDIKALSLFLDTKNPSVKYKNLDIPLDSVKVYLNFRSLIKSKPKIDKINLQTKKIDSDQLKKIILKTKPSNFNSIINNKIKNGQLIANFELYFEDNFKLDNFIVRGEVKDVEINVIKKIFFKNTSFNFFADSTDILITNLEGATNGILITNGDLKIERNKNLTINSNFVTEINLNEDNRNIYLKYLGGINNISKNIKLRSTLNNTLNLSFDQTYKLLNYEFLTSGSIQELKSLLNKSLKNDFFRKKIESINFKKTKIKTRISSDKKNFYKLNGMYQLNRNEFQKYNIENKFHKENQEINLDIDINYPLSIQAINYEKRENHVAKITSNIKVKKKYIFIKNLNFSEKDNSIILENLKIKNGLFFSLGNLKVITFKKNKLENDFLLEFAKKIKISGKRFDASNINKIFSGKNGKNYFKRLNKDIEIDIKNIETPLSEKLENFKLIGSIKDGKFIKISSKGEFGDNRFLDISLKSDQNNKKKFLEVYSDIPQTLLSEYKFFKGLTGGVLIFSSIIEENLSVSKLTIENFKIINAPGVVKLLSLADFGGLADLAEGEGLSFEKLEIKMSNEKNFLKLDELYAVGPSISVLMEGYRDQNNLTSLRGTLVPAKNLNKLLSKIPVIGDIIIPKEVGEGLFGVSFKMKGPPGKIKTSINPIKTLTPRFITKALERSKKAK